jgi:hypothetical protein
LVVVRVQVVPIVILRWSRSGGEDVGRGRDVESLGSLTALDIGLAIAGVGGLVDGDLVLLVLALALDEILPKAVALSDDVLHGSGILVFTTHDGVDSIALDNLVVLYTREGDQLALVTSGTGREAYDEPLVKLLAQARAVLVEVVDSYTLGQFCVLLAGKEGKHLLFTCLARGSLTSMAMTFQSVVSSCTSRY